MLWRTSGELTSRPGPRAGWFWWVREGAEAEVQVGLEALMADPEAVLAGPHSQARERTGRKRFYRLEREGASALYVKSFQARPGPLRWLGWLLPSKARREARVARAVRQRGFQVAAPLAVGERRTAGGRLVQSLCVTRELDACDLRTRLERGVGASERRALMRSFGAFTRALHDAGVDQDDSSPNNFLVAGAPGELRWTLIDFERCRVRRPLSRRRRWHLLAKLARHDLGVSRAERLRFLECYAGGVAARRAAWTAIERESLQVHSRALRHARRGAFQLGRQIAREGEAWVVRGRERADTLTLELPAREARRSWILAHQLERLALPALRPARLDARGLALLRPAEREDAGLAPDQRARIVERARRALLRFGRFQGEPRWFVTGERAWLVDPRVFRVELGPRAANSGVRRSRRAPDARYCAM